MRTASALCLALGIAASAATASSPKAPKPQAAAPQEPESPASALRALTKLLASDPQAVADVVERLTDRIWREGSGGGYVSAKARKVPDQRERLKQGVAAWVQSQLGDTREDVGAAAELYFVMGAGETPPQWTETPELKGKLGGFRSEELRRRMRPWSEPPLGGKQPITSGQLGVKRQQEWIDAFLADAAENAERFTTPGKPARPDNAAVEGLEERLEEKGSRRPQPGEFKRFEKVKELIPPPLPQIHQIVPDAAKPVTDPVLKPVDKVIHPIDGVAPPADSPEKPAAAPATP